MKRNKNMELYNLYKTTVVTIWQTCTKILLSNHIKSTKAKIFECVKNLNESQLNISQSNIHNSKINQKGQ